MRAIVLTSLCALHQETAKKKKVAQFKEPSCNHLLGDQVYAAVIFVAGAIIDAGIRQCQD